MSERGFGQMTQDDGREPLVYGPLQVQPTTQTVYVHHTWVHLAKKEYQLLAYLLRHQGQVLSRAQLLSDVWHSPATVRTRTVDIHICILRKKLGSAVCLETISGIGYKLQLMDNERKPC